MHPAPLEEAKNERAACTLAMGLCPCRVGVLGCFARPAETYGVTNEQRTVQGMGCYVGGPYKELAFNVGPKPTAYGRICKTRSESCLPSSVRAMQARWCKRDKLAVGCTTHGLILLHASSYRCEALQQASRQTCVLHDSSRSLRCDVFTEYTSPKAGSSNPCQPLNTSLK